MDGRLHLVTDPATGAAPIIFLSAPFEKARAHLVFVPGLTDRLLALPSVIPRLLENLPSETCLVQCQLRSAGTAFGSFTIANDVDDILAVCSFLVDMGSKSIVLMGHSTGCQDCVAFIQAHSSVNGIIKGIILQAPVSDRLYIMSAIPESASVLSLAKEMIGCGKGNNFLPDYRLFDSPITAYRFASLAGRRTEDDLFSPDLTDQELILTLGRLSLPSLWAFSLNDEYVPQNIDQRLFAQRITDIIPNSSCFVISGANHDLSNEDVATEFIGLVTDFLRKVLDMPGTVQY